MKADEDTLARLMRAAQKGDGKSYSVLLSECSIWLSRYYRRRAPPDRIDDLVQDVLLAIHSKRSSYDPKQPFLPWLAAIARYRWVDSLRKHYKHAEKELTDDVATVESDEDAVMARVSLDRMLGNLPDKQADATEMVKIEGCSIRDAAERSGQSESAIKVNIHRGLRKLAALVEEAV